MDVVAGIFNKLVVATPFLLVTTLGLKARGQNQAYSYTAYSPIENRNISAYIPLVKETEQSIEGRDFLDREVARKLAQKWIGGASDGTLKPLPQIATDDSSREGAKSEILRDAELVAESLDYQANSELQAKQYQIAVNDSLLALKVLSVPRMFDFASLSACSIPQRRALDIVQTGALKLSESTRKIVKKELGDMIISRQNLTPLTMDARSVLLRFEESPNVGNEDFQKLETYISPNANVTALYLRKIKNVPLGEDSDDGLVDLVNEYRLGYASALEMNDHIERVQSAL